MTDFSGYSDPIRSDESADPSESDLMPELPEVETMVRGIRPVLEGHRLIRIAACRCPCRPIVTEPAVSVMNRLATGQTITAVRRRAKRIVLVMSSESAFVIEPRMTGLMLVDEPPDQKHLRLKWQVESSSGVASVYFWDQRGLGVVRLLNPERYHEFLNSDRIGPDALEMSFADWHRMAQATGTPVKVALLDQHRVAGIGNLYASEILHVAGIAPQTPANRLSRSDIQRMADATVMVLEEAIRHEGSTLSDGTYRNALNQAGGYQNAHRVYDRAAEVCLTCGKGVIERIVQAQRSTFFCPNCQKPRARKRTSQR